MTDEPAARVAARPDAPVDVIVGPKTRLGAELLRRVAGDGGHAVALARHERDAQDLAALDHVLAGQHDDAAFREALAGRPVRVHVCALGPIHPEQASPTDSAAAERELATLERIMQAADGGVHVVLVSTVIALAPGADRRYYGGWKAVVEQRLAELVDRHSNATLTVLYPGRLVAGRDARRPWQLAYTTYGRLAALSLAAATHPGRNRLVGADARAWLLLRSVALAVSSITGRPGGRRSARRISP